MQFVDKYSGFSAIVFILSIGLIVWYETDYITHDTKVETVISILQWFGTVVAGQVIFIVIWEGIMVLAARLREKRIREALERGRKEGREEGREEILSRLSEEQRRQLDEWLKDAPIPPTRHYGMASALKTLDRQQAV